MTGSKKNTGNQTVRNLNNKSNVKITVILEWHRNEKERRIQMNIREEDQAKNKMVYEYYYSDEKHADYYEYGADTIEDCLKEAQDIYKDADRIYIAKTEKYKPSVTANGLFHELYLEAVQTAGDAAGGWLGDVSQEDEEALEEELNDVLDRWLEKTGHKPTFYFLTDIKDYPIIR